MSVIYTHLTYEEFKELERQMKAFKETSHRTEGGFYHKSIRLNVNSGLIMEFHGPLVGGYGHNEEKSTVQPRPDVPRTIAGVAVPKTETDDDMPF